METTLIAMNAIQILVAQHRGIEALFQELARVTRRSTGKRLFARLAEELIAHMAAEESVFYPAARRALGERGTAERLRDQHVKLRIQLRRVLETKFGHAAFASVFDEFRALFRRHVEAEERELFPRLEKALPKADLEVLGAQVLASRPPVWMVTTEGAAPVAAGDSLALRSRVSLPFPPTRG